MKSEVDKLEIIKLVNVPTSLNNFKTKVDDLDVGKLKTVPVDLKTLSDTVDNKVFENVKINTDQYNTDQQNLERKKLEISIKQYQTQVVQ